MDKADVIDPPRRLDIKGFVQSNGRMILSAALIAIGVYCAGTVLLLTISVSQRFALVEQRLKVQQDTITQITAAFASEIGAVSRKLENLQDDYDQAHKDRDGRLLPHPGRRSRQSGE